MKKKVLLFIALIVLLVPTFIFLVPVKDGRTVYKNIKYKQLLAGAVQPDNYDKMKISYVRIVERKTGTEKFNTPDFHSVDDGSILSDMDGHDVSEKDNFVRTFDKVQYKLEVGVALNLDNPDVTETTQLNGGVIKIRATLPKNDEGMPYLYWENEPWMTDAKISSDGTILTASYVFSNNSSVVGGNQQLVFNINTSGFPTDLSNEQMPKFEVWMEGNKPDNVDSMVDNAVVQDNEDLIISGVEKYNIRFDQPNINITGVRNGVKGQYVNFGVNLHLIGFSDDFEYKGVAIPTNREIAESKIQVIYGYSSSDTSYNMNILDEDYEGGILNGTELVAYNKSQYAVENPNAWPTPTSNYVGTCNAVNRDYGIYYYYGCGYIQGEYDSGNVNANLVSNILNITNEDMVNKNYSISSYATGMMFVDSIELFVPYLNDGNKHNYELTLQAIDYSVHNDNYFAQDRSSDNKLVIAYQDYLNGEIKAVLDAYSRIGYSDTEYIILNNGIKKMNSYAYVKDGPYLGGEERLIAFDSSKFELTKYKDDEYFFVEERYYGSDSESTPKDNQSMQYGVYIQNPGVGLNNNALINRASKNDFDWYDTIEEAQEHGVVTAMLWNNPDYRGFYKVPYLYFNIKSKGNSEDLFSTGMMRQKVWVYEDEERTVVHGMYTSDAEDSYVPTQYPSLNSPIGANIPNAGETLLFVDDYVRFAELLITYEKNSNNNKFNFNVLEERLDIGPELRKPIDYYNTSGNNIRKMTFTMEEDSSYLSYIANSCSVEPDEIEFIGNKTILHFTVDEYDMSKNFPDIRCSLLIDPFTPNNTKISFNSPSPIVYNIRQGANINYTNSITIVNLSGSSTRKNSSKEYIDVNEPFEISGNINNISDEALTNVKTIEYLPKNGDSRNSVIHGSYTIKINELAEGMSLYYATGNIEEIGIETDGLGYKHIKNVDLANDDRWTQVNAGGFIPPEATAIATLTDTIPTQTSKGFTYQVIPSNNIKGDVYYFGQYASSDNLVENIFSTYKAVTVVDRRISGTVFEDLNRNDLLNDTDAKLNEFMIELLNETGVKLDETTTDVNGHYEFSLPDKGTYFIKVGSIPDGYELVPKGTTSDSSKIDSTLLSDLINQSGVAHNAIEEIDNINVGIRKKEATLVVKYLDKNDGHALVEQTEDTVYYTDNYETHGLTTIPENYSFLENAGDPVADVVNKDYIEVIYYYDFTPATITAKHYIDGTSTKIHEDVIQNKKLTQPYSTSVLDTTNLNYEYVRTDGDSASGTVDKPEITVNYYYKLKKGTVTTHHYLYDNGDTTTKLAPDVTREWNYTDTYTTSVSDQVPQNYEFYKKSNNYTNIMNSPSVEVNYYYRLKDSSLTTSINIVGTEEITSKDTKVEYEITYNAKVVDYIGNGTITINDTLPYEIDVDNSNLDGGVYDATDRTITWTVDWSDIDTYSGRDENIITKNISLKYIGIVGRDRIMTNNVHSNILLSNSSRDAEAQTSTNIRINGNIKVVYVDKDTGEEIADTIEETNLVGEEFISSAIAKDGYKLVTKPDSETFEFEEEDQLITYEYEHIKFEIKGVVLGVGGRIHGDEDVYWGDDSTEGNIIVEADDGYIIEAILVNGERMDIEPGQVTLVLENFKEVLENKNIEVIFAKKPQENPNTKAFIGLIILISWLILFTNAILLKKSQELE